MKEYQIKSSLALAIRAILWRVPIIGGSLMATIVYANTTYTININQLPLDKALNQIEIQTGIIISYDSRALSNLQSSAIRGHYSVNDALTTILAPHNLVAIKVKNNAYRVENKTRVETQDTQIEAVHNQETSRTGMAQLPTLSFNATSENITKVGKQALDIKEIPQSVTVMSRERIDEQGLKTLDDVMVQTTGVTREQLWLNNNYSARGLKIENIRYDGGSASSLQDRSNSADLAQYESVEVLRGADDLFGAGEAGGVIGLNSKRPKAETAMNGTISAGSWKNYRAELDVTGSLTQDQSIKGRLVTVFQDQDFFYKPTHNRREMIYGALSFDLQPETTLFTGISYQNDKTDAFNASLPRWEDGADLQLPRSTTMGAPWGWVERENLSFFANLQHQLNDNWKAQLNARHNIGDDAINGAEMEGAVSYDTFQSQWWRYQDDTSFKE